MTDIPDDVVEMVARALAPEAWRDDGPIPTRAGVEGFHERRQRSCRDATAAISVLQSAGLIVPPGYVAVPVEPTEAMVSWMAGPLVFRGLSPPDGAFSALVRGIWTSALNAAAAKEG